MKLLRLVMPPCCDCSIIYDHMDDLGKKLANHPFY